MAAMQGTKGNIHSRILGHHPSQTWGGTVGEELGRQEGNHGARRTGGWHTARGWCRARDGVNHRLAWAMDSYRSWAGVDHGLMWAVALAHLRAQP